MSEIKIYTAGDSSLLIEFEQKISPEINAQITAVVRMIKAQQIEGGHGYDPGFRVASDQLRSPRDQFTPG